MPEPSGPPRRKVRVALIFGGRSPEHEVSVRSAASVLEALDSARYDVIPVAIESSGKWLSPAESARLLPGQSQQLSLPEVPRIGNGAGMSLINIAGAAHDADLVDVVFPVLHGTYGEDGTIQGLLELADMPYVGSGVLGSAAGMDKDVMKRLFRQAGLLTPMCLCVRRNQWRNDELCVLGQIEQMLDYPMFTKPANSGSSIGIRKVHGPKELPECLAEAFGYDRKVLVEEGIAGRELECSVLGNHSPRASVVGEIIPGGEFYDYEQKYLKDSTRFMVPAELPTEVSEEVRRVAIAAFRACECEGLARVDFFYEERTGRVLVNELNTMPGFTSISMYPKLWAASGLSYPELVDELIRLALERHQDRAENRVSCPG